jgi:hypothetical protein
MNSSAMVGARPREVDAGLHPREHEQAATAAWVCRGQRPQRDPHAVILGKAEAWRHDADNGVGAAVDRNGPANDRSVAQKTPPPHIVADDDHGFGADLIVVRGQVAAERRRDAESGKQVPGNGGPVELLRLGAIGQGDRAGADGDDGR